MSAAPNQSTKPSCCSVARPSRTTRSHTSNRKGRRRVRPSTGLRSLTSARKRRKPSSGPVSSALREWWMAGFAEVPLAAHERPLAGVGAAGTADQQQFSPTSVACRISATATGTAPPVRASAPRRQRGKRIECVHTVPFVARASYRIGTALAVSRARRACPCWR